MLGCHAAALPSSEQISFPNCLSNISTTVGTIALDSKTQNPTSSQCFLIWLQGVRGNGIPCDMPPCGKVIDIR